MLEYSTHALSMELITHTQHICTRLFANNCWDCKRLQAIASDLEMSLHQRRGS